MKKIALIVALLVGLMFTSAGSALAVAANITPASQTHTHLQTSNWTLTWGNTSPYHVEFDYGDGVGLLWQNTNIVSYNASYGFAPCPGDPSTYNQLLDVLDGWNNSTGHFKGHAQDTSSATTATGTPC